MTLEDVDFHLFVGCLLYKNSYEHNQWGVVNRPINISYNAQKGRTSVTGFDSNLLNWFSVIYLVFKAFSVRMHRVVHSNSFHVATFQDMSW